MTNITLTQTTRGGKNNMLPIAVIDPITLVDN